MKKKFAFTLLEFLLCLTILGIVASILINSFIKGHEKTVDKITKSKAFRAIQTVQTASQKIRTIETAKCPMQSFMVNIAGTWEYALSGVTTSDAVLSMYADYIRFQSTSLNYCDYTSTCSDNTIKAGKLPGDVYIGFKLYSNISDCPTFYDPETGNSVSGRGKCWGELHINISDHMSRVDTKGKNVFIFGLDQNGVAF